MEDATVNHQMTLSAVDLGSNTFRLMIARFDGARPAVLVKCNVTVRSGHGLPRRGKFCLDWKRAEAILSWQDLKYIKRFLQQLRLTV